MTAPPAPTSALPSRATPRGAQPLERLFEVASTPTASASRGLSPELRALYDGDLVISLRDGRPTVVSNFVATIDGAVALLPGARSGGGEVSGFSPTDRLVMGLLRALADVVLVGAATLRASSGKARTAGEASPPAAAAIADLRRRLGLARRPTLLVATSGGELDTTLPAFRDADSPVVIAAPQDAAGRLRSDALGPHVRVEALHDGAARLPHELLGIATRLGARVVLSEAGPHLTAQLVGAGLLDELFLTLAPQLVGRDADAPRLNLLEGVALWPSAPAWAGLVSVRRAGDHLFLRYRIAEDAP